MARGRKRKSTTNDVFEVERILEKRVRKGEGVQYLVKWVGYPDSDNTWESEDNFATCKDLVEDFESRQKAEKKVRAEAKPAVGFERGLEPEAIIGAVDSGDGLLLRIKWLGSDASDLVPAAEANRKCPQTVIKFYESQITWQ